MSEETKQQKDAIGARGKTIVSASAGSGKTFVMVSRLCELIAGKQADVRNVLAVTFTNKAAAQMRDRIRGSLLSRMKDADGETRGILRGQIKALPLADISTIHAFCGRLIRTYFYLIGIDPAFRIVGTDDAEGMSLSARALERTFEDAYEEADGDFLGLLAVYFRKKNDGRLKEIVTRLHTAARGDSGYRGTLEKIADGKEDKFNEAVLLVTEEMKRIAGGILKKLSYLEERIPGAPPKVQEYYAAIRVAAEQIACAKDVFDMAPLPHGIPRSPSRTDKNSVEVNELITRLAGLAGHIKENAYKKLKEYHTRDKERELYEIAQKQAAALARLVLRYDEVFEEVKRDAGVLDYSDLEQFALKLLSMPEVKDALREKYKFVFVDEYQDVNPMQEKILSVLAENDVFLVGDDKQAIYGFRGSKSKYFLEKAESYAEIGNNLNLSANFRSAENILHAVNTVFTAVLGDRYLPMEGGALYGDYKGEVFFHNLPEEEEEPAAERGVYSVCNAMARSVDNKIARKVALLVEEECGRKHHPGKQIYDVNLPSKDGSQKGGERSVNYGDIAVLVRKNTKAAGAIVNALSERGIPVTASAEVNVCDYFEVRVLTDWLELIDNPEQDIPTASAMLSALGGFSESELAHIRLNTRHGLTFRAACAQYQKYAEKTDPISQKLVRFTETLTYYRALSQVRSAAEMLTVLLADGIEAQIAAKGDSANRLARVRRLIAESEGAGHVHAFLRRLKDCDYKVDFSETGGENAVHVLTMHASKGLEFPVVILTELDEDFRGPDHDDVMWTDDFHIAPRAMDGEKKVYYDTVIRKAAALTERRATLEGERNLLYVGMTRACSRLHMVYEGGWDASISEEDEFFVYSPDDAKKLSDFIPRTRMLAYLAGTEEKASFEKVEREQSGYRHDENLVAAILRAGAPYAFAASTHIPVKDSATGLMRKEDGGAMSEVAVFRHVDEEEGAMSEEEDAFAGADASFDTQTGLAYHAFLEHVEFGKPAAEELDRMRREEILPPEHLALLDERRLQAILDMPCMRALTGKTLMREQRFLVAFPACDFAEAYKEGEAEDEVIFQGALDLLVEEEKGKKYTLIDYKFSSRSDAEIRTHYAVQIKLYKKTVAKITGASENSITTRIVNIASGREIEM